MSLHQTIREYIKESMRKRDTLRLDVLRGMLAEFTNEIISLKRKPQEELGDSEALLVIRRLVKQRKDSIEQFNKGNRKDLVKIEEEELKILDAFLPAQLGEDELRKIAEKKVDEFKNSDATVGAIKPNIGLIVGAVIKEAKGNADGNVVKKIVEEILK